MRNRMSLLLGLALVGLLGCGTLEQQRPAPPVLGGVASGQTQEMVLGYVYDFQVVAAVMAMVELFGE